MSFDFITFWISISPSLSPIPLMFQVTTCTGCAFFESATGIKLPGGLITFGVSWSISYLLSGMHCWVSLLMASANSVRPDSEKCSPSLPKCDRNRWSSLSTCILWDLEQMCLMKTFIFSIFVFSDTLSNLIGSSLRMRCPCLLCLRISRTTSFIFLMQVPTSSRGTLFVPA